MGFGVGLGLALGFGLGLGLGLRAGVRVRDRVLMLTPRAGELQRFADGEGSEVLRHLAAVWEAHELRARVELDDEVDETELVVRGRRRVLALDLRASRLVGARVRGEGRGA